jgi:hypothetical protein
VFESCRAVGVICYVWVTTCCSSAPGRDCRGVVFGSVGLCTNGTCGFQGLTEAWVVTVFLVVIELGHRALGKVFLYPVKVIAHCNCGAP